MTTAVQVARFRAATDALSLAATGEAVALFREVAQPNPVAVRKALIKGLPAVLQPYITASGELSAVWYEDLRREAVGAGFYAEPIDTLADGLVSGIARHAVSPLFGQGNATVASLLAGSVQKAVAGAGRSTIDSNVRRDRVKVAYARVPQAGCCAFCAMLASRGAVYGSERSAGGVVGRGVEAHRAHSSSGRYIGMRGGGTKVQGVQALGSQYHSFCRCTATPVFQGQEVPYDLAKYEEMYSALWSAENGYHDLSNIRSKYGIR
ncbi:hypothetical protein [Mycetocola saprophilus]|uniref:VG15 protein n=1 Tax=Mycetocola saprophilus TaxID=76636 RepID=UPI0004BF6F87|nr:hypothetical protein [Mycetocola saprophilus]